VPRKNALTVIFGPFSQIAEKPGIPVITKIRQINRVAHDKD
jgi:hypothetical protein